MLSATLPASNLIIAISIIMSGALIHAALTSPANTYRILAYHALPGRIALIVISLALVLVAGIEVGRSRGEISFAWHPLLWATISLVVLLIFMAIAERIAERLIKAQQQ